MARHPAALTVLSERQAADRGAAAHPTGTGRPRPPAHLPPAAAAVWDSIAPPIVAAGYLREQDSILLGELCSVLAELAQPAEDTNTVALRKLVVQYSDRLGLSPRARCAVDLPEDEADDPLAGLK